MRKNIIKITALALLSCFALTACDDDIIAKPTGYEDDNSPVVNISGFDGKVYNNNFTDIYDSIREGNLPQDVLNELLYQYATSIFGNYNKVTAAKITNNPYGETTLKAAVAGLTIVDGKATGGNATTDKFIQEHSAYWTKNHDGKRVDSKNQVVEDEKNAKPTLSEYARLYNKWLTIEKRIAKNLYSAISGGSYNDRNIFYEAKYLHALDADIENNIRSLTGAETFEGILTSGVEDYEVFTEKTKDINGNEDYILHRENYQSNAGLDKNEEAGQDATYVEDKLIPNIYRQLLVEQYILDESYDTLGRTSARHVDVLSISKNSNYAKGAVNLMNQFINSKIFDSARTTAITLDDFKVVSNAWVGAFMSEADYASTEEYKLINAAVPEYKVDGTSPYFLGTAYGDMMEEIEKINDNPKLSENETSYTGSNAYTWETGKDIKTRELQLKDYTFTGWYVKSVGVSGLPDSIKNQLFDINVANALDADNNKDKDGNPKFVEYEYKNNEWTTNEDQKKANSLINVVGAFKNVPGQYFLRNTSRIKGNPVQSDLLFESDGTYYIVLVQDAIRSKNLNKSNYEFETGMDENTYANKLNKLEEYINEIVQLVADNDTYQTLSKKHWIKKMDLKHHDTKVYEYFKSTFPELYEDDD